jgi:hypothetical protein
MTINEWARFFKLGLNGLKNKLWTVLVWWLLTTATKINNNDKLIFWLHIIYCSMIIWSQKYAWSLLYQSTLINVVALFPTFK